MTETTEHRAMRIAIEREMGAATYRGPRETMTEDELRAAIAAANTARNRKAGFRALENKCGHDAARRIVAKHNGRR